MDDVPTPLPMETTRVDICYRPLRIAWAIRSGDRESFRRVVRLTHTLWGGRFNPIVMADRANEAKQIVELFRADLVLPIGDAAVVGEFPKQFPYLINPLFPEMLFVGDTKGPARAHALGAIRIRWIEIPEPGFCCQRNRLEKSDVIELAKKITILNK